MHTHKHKYICMHTHTRINENIYTHTQTHIMVITQAYFLALKKETAKKSNSKGETDAIKIRIIYKTCKTLYDTYFASN